MKAKRVVALLLGAMATVPMVACGGGGSTGGGGNKGNSKITTIQFMDYGGGVGSVWLYNAKARFEEKYKNKSYEAGKMGVEISIQSSKDIPYDTMSTTGFHIFTTEQKADIYTMASKNELLCLNDPELGIDVVSQIADIDDNQIERLKGPDGNIYALPHYEWFPGITYDVDYFDLKNYYFAAPEVPDDDCQIFETDFGRARMTGYKGVKKSVGPNGLPGDYDDGLPSSLEEFFILCAVINTHGGRAPMVMSGTSVDYAFYFPHGLWANLAGADQMETIYSHNSEGKECVEVITGWTDEELFYPGSNIYKPTTEMVAITEDNAYKAFDQAARFYSLAALHVMYDKQWFNSTSAGSNVTAFEAQSHFITDNGGAMLYDSSYWYAETVRQGNIEHHITMNPENPERNLSYMPMPSQVFGSVEEGKGHENVLLDNGSSQMFVNRRITANPGLTEAIKDLLLFLYSDAELAAFTETTGAMRAMDYEFDNTKSYDYYNRMNEIRLASTIVRPSSSSNIFKKNLGTFNMTWSGSMQRPVINNTVINEGYLQAMKLYGVKAGKYEYNTCASAQNIWESTRKTAEEWAKLAR